jgi:MoaA/NifB/PqqE/SkfB family radical SAM enzyme
MLKQLGQWRHSKLQRAFNLFQIEPSLECHLNCVMCPWADIRPEQAQMTWATFERIVPELPRVHNVDFTGGGEPTINPRLPDMIRVAKEAGCAVGFSTNANRLDDALANALITLGLDWVSFSIDGATAGTYEHIRRGANFARITGLIAALHDLKRARHSPTPRLMAVFVMMHENYHELPAFIELAQRLGIEQVIAKNLDVILKDGDDERRLFSHDRPPLKELHDVITVAQKRAHDLKVGLRLYALQPQEQSMCEHDPLRNLFFNYEGHVSPCITLSYAENRVFNGERQSIPCQRFGNITTEALDDIWNKPEYREFRRQFEVRGNAARQAMLDLLLSRSQADPPLPAAPEGCRTCYYLYGV